MCSLYGQRLNSLHFCCNSYSIPSYPQLINPCSIIACKATLILINHQSMLFATQMFLSEEIAKKFEIPVILTHICIGMLQLVIAHGTRHR